MKYLKPTCYIALLLACSYAALWYGFYKGFEYGLSGRMTDVEQKRSVLVSLRQGETDQGIEQLEMQIGGDILSAYYSESGFEKYIIGAAISPPNAKSVFSNRILSYMQKYPYKCHPDKETCEAIQTAVKNMAEMPPNKSLKDAP